jgi:hypothetical protein
VQGNPHDDVKAPVFEHSGSGTAARDDAWNGQVGLVIMLRIAGFAGGPVPSYTPTSPVSPTPTTHPTPTTPNTRTRSTH